MANSILVSGMALMAMASQLMLGPSAAQEEDGDCLNTFWLNAPLTSCPEDLRRACKEHFKRCNWEPCAYNCAPGEPGSGYATLYCSFTGQC